MDKNVKSNLWNPMVLKATSTLVTDWNSKASEEKCKNLYGKQKHTSSK